MTKQVRLIAMLTTALAAAVPAFAQMAQPTLRTGRPTRALFGSGVGDTDQSLMLNLSFGGGYDWDDGGVVTGGAGAPTTAAPSWTGTYGSGSGSLAYSISRGRVGGGASIGGSAHYNPNRTVDPWMKSVGASAQISFKFSERSSLAASQGISVQPFNIQRLFGNWINPDVSPDVFMDLGGVGGTANQFSSHSAVNFRQGLTSRIGFSAQYFYQTYNAWSGAPDTASHTSNASAGLSYQIVRGVRLGAAYRYTSSRYGTGATTEYSGLSLDGGLNFDRAISLSRRTSLNFGTGFTGARDESGQTRYFLTGNAALSYEIGRSWTTSLHYRRGVDFAQGFNVPVVIDTLSAGIGGDIGRRVQLTANGGATRGELGIGPGAREYTVLSGSVSLRTAITQMIGVSTGYSYRHYKFDDPASLPAGMRPEIQRHGARVSLDLKVPLFTRTRRSDASR